MPVNVTFLGHAGFVIDDGNHAIAIDPFLTGNPVAVQSADQIKVQTIALTHAHADHLGDTAAIAKANGATVIAAFEICEYLAGQGVEKLEPANPGGRVDTDFGYVALTPAFHSNSFEGKYMGQPAGLIINLGGKTFYHTGDTALFSDMRLIGEIYQPDVAMICAGDRFTMGPDLAARAAELIGAPVAIPIHFGTWPLLRDETAVRQQFTPPDIDVRFIPPGDTWTT